MWPNPEKNADLVAFTEDILNGKLDFCAVWIKIEERRAFLSSQKFEMELGQDFPLPPNIFKTCKVCSIGMEVG